MFDAISNTSPLLYLHRIDALDWLPKLFGTIWTSNAVVTELEEGRRRGFDAPEPNHIPWIDVVKPQSIPSEWLALDLGAGELSVMALALENRDRVVLLDDALARRIAQAADLAVWGTLRILMVAKEQGLIERIEPFLERLATSGMWISNDVRRRVLLLAREGMP